MPAKDLGNKFVCFKCSTKFYDMKKPDPVCPKCGADQRESPALKPQPEGKRSRLAAVPKVVEPVDLGDEPEPVAEEEAEAFEDEDAEAETPADDDEA
ncbi:MAG TPA: FYDLN acid domain-containing protein [Myxococcales bacterium]|jgi:uncharacterized protein (TIGR02300 family)|nr:FYDLN acid domain-containing protein [Myxococcales bacterium]